MRVIIPFRLNSKRFPNKVMSIFKGKTLLEHAIENALQINSQVTLTAPLEDFFKIAPIFDTYNGVKFMATDKNCYCGTDRALKIYQYYKDERFIILPIDEPAIIPSEIIGAIKQWNHYKNPVAILYTNFYCEEEADSLLSAKMVLNKYDELVYMSRSRVPSLYGLRGKPQDRWKDLFKNVGVSFLSRGFFNKLLYYGRNATSLQGVEGLEQLRWLELEMKIKCIKINHYGFGIDEPWQLEALEQRCIEVEKQE